MASIQSRGFASPAHAGFALNQRPGVGNEPCRRRRGVSETLDVAPGLLGNNLGYSGPRSNGGMVPAFVGGRAFNYIALFRTERFCSCASQEVVSSGTAA